MPTAIRFATVLCLLALSACPAPTPVPTDDGGVVVDAGASDESECPASRPFDSEECDVDELCTYGDTDCTCERINDDAADGVWVCNPSACTGVTIANGGACDAPGLWCGVYPPVSCRCLPDGTWACCDVCPECFVDEDCGDPTDAFGSMTCHEGRCFDCAYEYTVCPEVSSEACVSVGVLNRCGDCDADYEASGAANICIDASPFCGEAPACSDPTPFCVDDGNGNFSCQATLN